MKMIKDLYDLQELDWEIADADKTLAEVRNRLEDDSELTVARLRLDELLARIEGIYSDHRSAERKNAEHQEELQKVESRLYGGAVTNSKALSAAGEERDFIMGRLTEQQDRILEFMVEMEDVDLLRNEAQSMLDRLETERPKQKTQLIDAEKQLMSELEIMGQKRDQIIPSLPSVALPRYESIRKSKNGHAVAKVIRGVCQGCRLTVTTMELQRARTSENITQCSSCQRILYVV